MQKLVNSVYRALRMSFLVLSGAIHTVSARVILFLYSVKVSNTRFYGLPFIHLSSTAKMLVGKDVVINSGIFFCDSGFAGRCRIEVRKGAQLTIGDRVGMSNVTISCHAKIEIGNNVLLGVGTSLRDSDSHSMVPSDWFGPEDQENAKSARIIIEDNVFVGANSTILKGVTIGSGAVVGAGSVVSKDIPAKEVWAGNPARKIRSID